MAELWHLDVSLLLSSCVGEQPLRRTLSILVTWISPKQDQPAVFLAVSPIYLEASALDRRVGHVVPVWGFAGVRIAAAIHAANARLGRSCYRMQDFVGWLILVTSIAYKCYPIAGDQAVYRWYKSGLDEIPIRYFYS